MMTARYQVVRKDNGPNNPNTGVVSNHKTIEAAQSAIARANRRLRHQPGQQTAWHPYVILDTETGEIVRG